MVVKAINKCHDPQKSCFSLRNVGVGYHLPMTTEEYNFYYEGYLVKEPVCDLLPGN